MLKNKLLLLNIALLIIIIGLSLYLFVFSKNINWQIERPYYAVYLRTGDLYFGHLSKFFSKYTLTNVYLLQRDSGGNFSLQKFSQSVYQPEDKLILNRDNIVWISKIQKDSPLIPILEGKQKPVAAPNESVSTTTTTTIESNLRK
jgi:hypothetical protein